jgi:hypothetical protein
MKLVFIVLLLTGCGRIGVSDSKHEVGGEATVRVVVGIDVTACEGLPPEGKLECITTILDLIKTIQENQSASDALPTIR